MDNIDKLSKLVSLCKGTTTIIINPNRNDGYSHKVYSNQPDVNEVMEERNFSIEIFSIIKPINSKPQKVLSIVHYDLGLALDEAIEAVQQQ